jgi:MoaA/NifB/PqqE/SkfB family radical SAM enzyme
MPGKFANHYLPELISSITGRPVPGSVSVNLTSRCNQQCIYCEIGQDVPSSVSGQLTREDMFWIMEQMALNRIRRISICGGEPFLFDGLTKLVAYGFEKKIRCAITTNGMTAYNLAPAELIIMRGCKTEINVSIDSFDEKINSLTRGSMVALANASKSIEKFSEYDIPLSLLVVISKYNYHDLFNFVKEAHAFGVKQVLFQPVISYSNYPDRKTLDEKSNLNVGPEKIAAVMEQLEKIHQFECSHHISTNVYRLLPWLASYLNNVSGSNGKWFFHGVLEKFYCRDVHAIIDITYDGGIQPCGLAKAEINIHERRELGLLALWHEATEKLKNDLKNERYHDICNGCCHHFSRNMMASVMRHPIWNRAALLAIAPLTFSRAASKVIKTLINRN